MGGGESENATAVDESHGEQAKDMAVQKMTKGLLLGAVRLALSGVLVARHLEVHEFLELAPLLVLVQALEAVPVGREVLDAGEDVGETATRRVEDAEVDRGLALGNDEERGSNEEDHENFHAVRDGVGGDGDFVAALESEHNAAVGEREEEGEHVLEA